jgi:hypothetical protein
VSFHEWRRKEILSCLAEFTDKASLMVMKFFKLFDILQPAIVK